MVMTVYGREIPCQRAERGADFVRAYDGTGNCVFTADKVKDFTGYALSGGTWSEAEPSQTERLEELEALMAALLFGGEEA